MNITQYAESKQIDNFIIFMIPNILEPQLQSQKNDLKPVISPKWKKHAISSTNQTTSKPKNPVSSQITSTP